MLEVDNIDVAYGDLQVLWDVSLEITEDDRVIGLVGPNGAGKTTLLRAIAGLLEVRSGSIRLFGKDVSKMSPGQTSIEGFVLVPEELELFTDMTVRENLEIGAYRNREKLEENIQEAYDLFPKLSDRRTQRVGTLSGGEQQMVAIARGLMADPKILALDEPTTGLAPQLAEDMFRKIEDISNETTVLMVEQHVSQTLEMAERGYVLEKGRISIEDSGEALLESDHVRKAYL